MPPLNRPSRRELLTTFGTLLAASSAGCSFFQGTNKGATDVIIYNERSTTESVTVRITAAEDDSPRLETTVTLDAGAETTPTASDKLPVGTDYTIEISVSDGVTETYRWTDVRLERAPLRVRLSDSGISFEVPEE
jgi:hypothetical protein